MSRGRRAPSVRSVPRGSLRRGLRRALQKVVKMCRHRRLWDVHNAWYSTRSTPAAAAGPPALATERMDEDGGSAHRAAAAPVEQRPGPSAAGGPRTETAGMPPLGELCAVASEFAPGLPMAEVEAAWHVAAAAYAAGETRCGLEVCDLIDLVNEMHLVAAAQMHDVPRSGG